MQNYGKGIGIDLSSFPKPLVLSIKDTKFERIYDKVTFEKCKLKI